MQAGACHARRTYWRAACRGYLLPATCGPEASSVLPRRWARDRSAFSSCIGCCANSPRMETACDRRRPEIRPGRPEPPVHVRSRELLGGVLFQPLDETHYINDHSLMGAGANGRDTICRFDLELDAATIDLGYLRSRDNLPADRRCRQMKHVDARSHGTLSGSKEGLDRVESSVLHGHDHDRRRQHRRQNSVLEAIG